MKSFFKSVAIIVIIVALICVISAKNKESDVYVMENIIPRTEKHVRHIIYIPQRHAVDYLVLNNPHNREPLTQLISERQKQIYFALIDLKAKVVFSEGYVASSGNNAIDAIRIARINEGAFLLGNSKDALEDIDLLFLRDEIMQKEFTYSKLELLYLLERENSDKADLVSHYKHSLEMELIIADDVANAILEMDEDRLFLDELNDFKRNIYAKMEMLNARLEKVKREREVNDQRLLREYPYFAGGDLKLASEGKIKILPGESSELNSQAGTLLDDCKREAQELSLKLLELEVSEDIHALFFQKNSALDLTTRAKNLGVLSEYLEFVNAEKAFDEAQEKRDDFLIESVAEYNGPEFDVAVVFGAAHEFSENVQNYNKRHPERQICLSRIKWKR